MLAAYGRPHARVAGADASHSRRPDRGTIFWTRAAEKNLRAQGQAHRSPSENARELAVYMYSSLQAVSFREAVRVEAPTQGAGSESGYCILYGLQIFHIR